MCTLKLNFDPLMIGWWVATSIYENVWEIFAFMNGFGCTWAGYLILFIYPLRLSFYCLRMIFNWFISHCYETLLRLAVSFQFVIIIRLSRELLQFFWRIFFKKNYIIRPENYVAFLISNIFISMIELIRKIIFVFFTVFDRLFDNVVEFLGKK